MSNFIPLKKSQSEIMKEFYSLTPTRVIYKKSERNKLWRIATSRSIDIDFSILNSKCPALSHQIKKSYDTGKNIQSAVFSECVYAQTYANMLGLNNFVNCLEDNDFLSFEIKKLLKSYLLYPRYSYYNDDKSRILVQAGGCNGIDCALITLPDLKIYTIEFKEKSAKTSEPDLPKYSEEGNIQITEEFLTKNPQFEEMLKEQTNLNFFEAMGSNIKNFSKESINIAVSNNYTKKYADVICTEDKNGYLTMLPVNQVSLWARIEGEIRPGGRNPYAVWTHKSLMKFLQEKNAIIKDEIVTINIDKLEKRKERGGNGKVSGYKINPIFFVYLKDCQIKNKQVIFNINRIRQLKPTISGKMFFSTLLYNNIKEYYEL